MNVSDLRKQDVILANASIQFKRSAPVSSTGQVPAELDAGSLISFPCSGVGTHTVLGVEYNLGEIWIPTDTYRDVGGTTPWMGEVEPRREQRSRATQDEYRTYSVENVRNVISKPKPRSVRPPGSHGPPWESIPLIFFLRCMHSHAGA